MSFYIVKLEVLLCLLDGVESNEFPHFSQFLAQTRHALVQCIHLLFGLSEMLLHAQELCGDFEAILDDAGVALALFDGSLEVGEFLDAGY